MDDVSTTFGKNSERGHRETLCPVVIPEAKAEVSVLRHIRGAIWIYISLLIVEGALRRWILPGLAGPLILVREPIAIFIVVRAVHAGLLRNAPMLWMVFGITFLSFGLTMVFGHRNLYVAMFGARILLLHLPLVYVIGCAFNLLDVLKVGRVFALVSLPMTALIAAQFFLPQSHMVNIGIGGDGTAGFAGAEGYFRPPGTFSFTSGVTEYYSLLGSFLLAFALLKGATRRLWWIVGVVCVALAVPLSISRGLLFQLCVASVFFLFAAVANRRLAPRLAKVVLVVGVLVLTAITVPSFRAPMVAFSARWNAANEAEGGVVEGVFLGRFLGELWASLTKLGDVPIAGLGLGLGTNAGAHLMIGERAFMIAEGEWFRVIGEMGPALGLIVVGFRVALSASILMNAYRSSCRGNAFPLLLSSVACLWVAQGNWAQPTSLGFAVVAGGLTLASCKYPVVQARNNSSPRQQSASLPTTT
ncbi:hypothetical protein ACXR0O_14790 [Verrucomicrobiota bacterium sgz303538]